MKLRTRNFTAIMLILCMAVFFCLPAYIYPYRLMADTQDDLDAVNKELEELKNKQSELDSQFSDLNNKVTSSGEKIAALEEQINSKQSDIDSVNADISDMEIEISHQYDTMKLRIRYMYENDSDTIISTLLSAQSLSDLLTKTEYVRQISDYDHKKMQELNDLIITLRDTKEQLQSELDELVALKDKASKEADTLSSLLEQCQTQIDTNSQSISDAEALALEYEQKIQQEMLERQRREMEALNSQNSSDNASHIDQNVLDQVLKNHSEQDVAMLAAIIECEAGNQSYEGKCAVGSVVINRVADPRFANSISGVIYAPYQFSPVASGRFAIVLARGANAECTKAAVDVLNGYININALYFHVYNSAVDKGGTIIGDHVFY